MVPPIQIHHGLKESVVALNRWKITKPDDVRYSYYFASDAHTISSSLRMKTH